MPAITKIWFFSLLPGKMTSDAKFVELWNDIFALVNSYTKDKPSAKDREQHVLLQSESSDDDAARQLALITGYPSLESNLEADREYASKFLGPMFELVKHDRLVMIEKDIDELPLESGRLELSFLSDEPASEQDNGAVGGWDVWQPPGSQVPPPKTTFVQVSPAAEPSAGGSESKMVFKRIMGI